MDETHAYFMQAMSDMKAGEFLGFGQENQYYSHAISCFHQSLEKAVKSFAKTLRDRGSGIPTHDYEHRVELFVIAFLRLPPRHKSIDDSRHQLHKLFDQRTKDAIRLLDTLVPRKPVGGEATPKNTEYPFQNTIGEWSYPANINSFSIHEFERFRKLTRHVVRTLDSIRSSYMRKPKSVGT